jgi:Fe2+ transport system protein FeoA
MRLNDTILSQIKTGESARIVDIGGGYGIRQKLKP